MVLHVNYNCLRIVKSTFSWVSLICLRSSILAWSKKDDAVAFVYCPVLILLSESLDPLPSSNVLFNGNVMCWSGPATAKGGWLFCLHPSQESPILQERNIIVPLKEAINKQSSAFSIPREFSY
jgi:hypothetical protein